MFTTGSIRISLTCVLLTACGDAATSGGDAGTDTGIDTGEIFENRCDVSDGCADTLVEAEGDTGEGTGDAQRSVNGVRGGGETSGSADVFSLGYEDDDNTLIIGWNDFVATNGPGTDLVVFENAFVIGDGLMRFMDQAIVSVSLDGELWVEFPHDYSAEDELEYSQNPDDWVGFAGVEPVLYHVDNNAVDPFDAEAAGGDHFDLDDLPIGDGDAIRELGFRFVRIVTAASQVNPDTGSLFPHEPVSNGTDVDGVFARYLEAG
jgi:hypothetical protein